MPRHVLRLSTSLGGKLGGAGLITSGLCPSPAVSTVFHTVLPREGFWPHWCHQCRRHPPKAAMQEPQISVLQLCDALHCSHFCSAQVWAGISAVLCFHCILFIKGTGICVLSFQLPDWVFTNSIFSWTRPRNSVQHSASHSSSPEADPTTKQEGWLRVFP